MSLIVKFSIFGARMKFISNSKQIGGAYHGWYGVRVRVRSGGRKACKPRTFGGVHHPLGGVPRWYGCGSSGPVQPKNSFFKKVQKVRGTGYLARRDYFNELSAVHDMGASS